MTTRHIAQARCLAAALILLLVGCGPTHTAGTNSLAAADLATLSVPQLPKESHLRIRTIQFDGEGDEYDVGEGHDFYLLPRDHTASFTVEAIVPSDLGLLASLSSLIPKDALIIHGPTNLPLGTMSAGKAYELSPPTQGFDKMLASGQLSLVHEKAK